jgi:hypothetical protein
MNFQNVEWHISEADLLPTSMRQCRTNAKCSSLLCAPAGEQVTGLHS